MKTKIETFAQLKQQLISLFDEAYTTITIEEISLFVTAITYSWKAELYIKQTEQTFQPDLLPAPSAVELAAPTQVEDVETVSPAQIEVVESTSVANEKTTQPKVLKYSRRKTLKPALNMTKQEFIDYCEKYLSPILDKELKKEGQSYLDTMIQGNTLYRMIYQRISMYTTFHRKLHLSIDNLIDSKVWFTWLEEAHRNWLKKRANIKLKTQYKFKLRTWNVEQVIDYLISHYDATYDKASRAITAKNKFKVYNNYSSLEFTSQIPADQLLEYFWAFDLEGRITDSKQNYLMK